MQPNKEAIRKWVDMLRSGEFKQGENALRTTDNKFCCLGVLCELAAREGIIPGATPNTSEMKRPSPQDVTTRTDVLWLKNKMVYDGCHNYPSKAVVDWAGIGDTNPQVKVGSEWEYVADMNDDGYSFTKIANAIERTFLVDEAV